MINVIFAQSLCGCLKMVPQILLPNPFHSNPIDQKQVPTAPAKEAVNEEATKLKDQLHLKKLSDYKTLSKVAHTFKGSNNFMFLFLV